MRLDHLLSMEKVAGAERREPKERNSKKTVVQFSGTERESRS